MICFIFKRFSSDLFHFQEVSNVLLLFSGYLQPVF